MWEIVLTKAFKVRSEVQGTQQGFYIHQYDQHLSITLDFFQPIIKRFNKPWNVNVSELMICFISARHSTRNVHCGLDITSNLN